MNERIRELALQAGATLEKGYIELSDGQLMLSDNVDLDKSNMDLVKFAELIWKAAYEEGHDVGVDAGFEAGRNASFTEQNFGVEE